LSYQLTHLLPLSVDPFLKKDWFDIKAPNMFNIRQVGKTLATKTMGLKNSRDSLLGRVFEVSLGDLKTKVTRNSLHCLATHSSWGLCAMKKGLV
jgi:ribosomal protein S3AE